MTRDELVQMYRLLTKFIKDERPERKLREAALTIIWELHPLVTKWLKE